MEKLRLLVNIISSTGIKGRAARKVVIAISGIKYLIMNDIKLQDLSWYRLTQTKEIFRDNLIDLKEKTKLTIMNSSDLNIFLDKVEEVEFQKIIYSLDSIDKGVKAIDLVKLYRSMANIKRESGEYVTNDNVLELGVRALNIDENSTIIDNFNGESGVITNICDQFSKEGKDFSSIKFFGQEIDKDSYEIGEFIAYLLLNNNFEIHLGDSIEKPAFIEEDTLKKFDYAVSVLPFIIKHKSDYVDKFNRFRYFKDKKINYSNPSWVLAEHVISTINENGKAAILMPIGALFRSSISDVTVKKALVNEDIIECIIKMPAGILNYTGVQTCWVIINKNKVLERKDKIQFIDLSEKSEMIGRRERVIPSDCIDKALLELNEMKESNISFIVDRKDIEENKYNLDIFEYMKQKELLKNIDLGVALRLSDVAIIRRGVQATKSKLDVLSKSNRKSHYLIGLGNIIDGKIVLNEEDKIAAEDRWIDLYEVREGDVLLTSKGSALKIVIVDKNIKNAILSSNLFLIRLNQNKYKPEILKYYLESKRGQELLSTIMKGAVIKSISNKDLEGLIIPNIKIEKQEIIKNKIMDAKRQYEEITLRAREVYDNNMKNIENMISFSK